MMKVLVFMCLLMTIKGYDFQDDQPCNTSFVIAFAGQTVKLYDLDTATLRDFVINVDLRSPVAVTADQREGIVFFTDVNAEKIFRKDFKSQTKSYVIRDLDSRATPDGIAVDTARHRVYYTDTGLNVIASMDYDGLNHQVLITREQNLDEPRAIVIDPQASIMYYTDWGSSAHISKADLSGENIVVLQNTGLKFPNGMTADFTSGKIYWCDAGLDSISVMDVDGSNRRALFTQELEFHFFDITLFNDYLYVTDWTNSAVFKMHKNGSTTLTRVVDGYRTPNGLAVVCIPQSQPVTDATTAATSAVTTSAHVTAPATRATTPLLVTSSTSTLGAMTTQSPELQTEKDVTTENRVSDGLTAMMTTENAFTKASENNANGTGLLNITAIIIAAMAIVGFLIAVTIVTIGVCLYFKSSKRHSKSKHTSAVKFDASEQIVTSGISSNSSMAKYNRGFLSDPDHSSARGVLDKMSLLHECDA